jgi:hypothetical protein
MTIHREIELSYHHKAIVQAVSYSPLMVEIEGGGVGEGGEASGGDTSPTYP